MFEQVLKLKTEISFSSLFGIKGLRTYAVGVYTEQNCQDIRIAGKTWLGWRELGSLNTNPLYSSRYPQGEGDIER